MTTSEQETEWNVNSSGIVETTSLNRPSKYTFIDGNTLIKLRTFLRSSEEINKDPVLKKEFECALNIAWTAMQEYNLTAGYERNMI